MSFRIMVSVVNRRHAKTLSSRKRHIYLLLCVQFSGFIHTLEPVVNFADFVDLQLIRVVKSGTVLATEFNAKIYFMRITDRLRISPYSMSV